MEINKQIQTTYIWQPPYKITQTVPRNISIMPSIHCRFCSSDLIAGFKPFLIQVSNPSPTVISPKNNLSILKLSIFILSFLDRVNTHVPIW